MDKIMPFKLTSAALFFAAGIWCTSIIEIGVTTLFIVAAVLFGVVAWCILRSSRFIAVALMGLFFVAGCICFINANTYPPGDIGEYVERDVTIDGVVSEVPESSDVDEQSKKVHYVIDVKTINTTEDGLKNFWGKVAVTLRQPRNSPIVCYGDKVKVSGRLVALHGYNNPGQIDAVARLKLQGIVARMVVKEDSFSSKAGADSWQRKLTVLRQRITANIDQAIAPSDAAILKGVLFGGYSGISRQVVRDFAVTGIVHILSVSGAHIALVAGFIAWAGGWFRLRKGVIAWLAAAAIVLYAVFAGLTPPVIRSLIMGLLALLAVGLGREKDASQALAFAVLIMLALQPMLLFDISFQLSFSATAGLVLFYDKTAEKLCFLSSWLAKMLAATIAAQLGALPFMAWYFNAFPVVSLLANIIIVPLIEVLVIVGLAASFLGLAIALLGRILLVSCGLLTGLIVDLTALIAKLPGGTIYLPSFGPVAGLIYYLLILWIYGYLPGRLPSPTDIIGGWRRVMVLAGIAVIVAACYIIYPRPMSVHFIDVGQGDATLVTTPHGRAVLIDTGGSGELSEFDVGERVVVPYLKHYGITQLDWMILTHGHKDHAGGAASVAAFIPVKSIIVAQEEFSASVAALVKQVKGHGLIPAYSGQKIVIDGVVFEVALAETEGSQNQSNESSTVVRVYYGSHSFWLTGDLSSKGEKKLLENGVDPVTVLKVGHHGSKLSTSTEFLQKLTPQHAVISVGSGNRFGHPHAETLTRLRAQGVDYYRTDLDGAVIFSTDGTNLKVSTFNARKHLWY
jgi:competence protein ComEC